MSVRAERDITLGDGARIDMAGRGTTLFDQTRYSWGGDVELESKSGNIIQSAGSVVDVSAVYNHAGSLRASAMGATAGLIALRGQLLGSASGEYDAGGTYVPFENGRIQLNGQSIEDFSGLNRRLTQTGVTGSRSFQTRIGDLTVGDESPRPARRHRRRRRQPAHQWQDRRQRRTGGQHPARGHERSGSQRAA